MAKKQRITIDLPKPLYNKFIKSKLFKIHGTMTATLKEMIRKLK